MNFLTDGLTWERLAYPELAARVGATAQCLRDAGHAGSRVALVADAPEAFITGFFAVVATGGTVVPLVPPIALQHKAEHPDRVRELVAAGRPDVVLGRPSFEVPGVPVLDTAGLDSSEGGAVRVDPAPPGHPALIQFSSGTTGAPTPIPLSRAAVDANVSMITDWLGMGDDDATATWLPLYHDMGLIGTVLVPIASQTELFVMTPMQFLRRPDEWLRCFGERGCTLTAAPPFGYVHAARRAKRDRLAQCDFSRWRVAIVGAEPLRAEALQEFVDAFGPQGFPLKAFCPAYGLGEATLAVTGVPPEETAGLLVREAAAGGGPIELVGDGTTTTVSSGRPLAGVEVEVRGLDGGVLPEGAAGEIWIRTPSLTDPAAYPKADRFEDGWFRTGDAGCIHGGELFVFGRIADSIKLRGQLVLAEEAEATLTAEVDGLGGVVVVPSRREGVGLTVLVEGQEHQAPVSAAELSARASAMFYGVAVDVVFVPRGAIPRTTSGKVRRRACWQQFVAADGPARVEVAVG